MSVLCLHFKMCSGDIPSASFRITEKAGGAELAPFLTHGVPKMGFVCVECSGSKEVQSDASRLPR